MFPWTCSILLFLPSQFAIQMFIISETYGTCGYKKSHDFHLHFNSNHRPSFWHEQQKINHLIADEHFSMELWITQLEDQCLAFDQSNAEDFLPSTTQGIQVQALARICYLTVPLHEHGPAFVHARRCPLIDKNRQCVRLSTGLGAKSLIDIFQWASLLTK